MRSLEVEVDAGATLTVLGTGFAAAELSGGGTIGGDIELEIGGVLEAGIAEDGSIIPLSVEGTLTLSGFSLELGGDATDLQPGIWTLVSAWVKVLFGEMRLHTSHAVRMMTIVIVKIMTIITIMNIMHMKVR